MRLVPIAAALAAAFVFFAAPSGAQTTDDAPSWDLSRGPLRISDDGRFLVHANGEPFFYLADTNWELIPRARREDAERLFETRRRQGFTVITAPVTGIMDDFIREDVLGRENVYGDLAFADGDVTRPIVTPGADPDDARQYDYWDHVDYILDLADSKGMYVALLPAWRVHYELGYVNEQNARAYGRFLGERFGARRNVIWVLGGDINIERVDDLSQLEQLEQAARSAWRDVRNRPDRRPITARLFRELAAGIREAEAFRHLMTYHPSHARSSAEWFHRDAWLDFNMFQSGHWGYDAANYELVAADYARTPVKPVIDGEASYEDHAVGHDPERGWFGAFDVRQKAYWALFAGAHGHAYGNRGVWQMYEPGREPHRALRYFWYDSMDLPGAWSMRRLRDLMTSRPVLGRVPYQRLVRDALAGGARVMATRGDGYAFVYTPSGADIDVALDALEAQRVAAWWFDPRTGAAARIGVYAADGPRTFDPPGEPALGNDWVLVLDDAQRGYPPPGAGESVVPTTRLEPGEPVDRPAQAETASPTAVDAAHSRRENRALLIGIAIAALLAAAAAAALALMRRYAPGGS